MNKQIICPFCDSDMIINNGYDYEYGILRYHCDECNSDFTELDISYDEETDD